MTIIGLPLLMVWQFPLFQALIASLLALLDALTKRFSFAAEPAGIAALHTSEYSFIAWVFLAALAIIVLSQALKMIEYVCFKLKI